MIFMRCPSLNEAHCGVRGDGSVERMLAFRFG
jgi:hypothetical protein